MSGVEGWRTIFSVGVNHLYYVTGGVYVVVHQDLFVMDTVRPQSKRSVRVVPFAVPFQDERGRETTELQLK